jgi:ParB family transcriptional regulator, chromosome partitioning protein
MAQLVGGLQRNELSPLGEARLYLKLMTEDMASIADITTATGRTRDQVARTLRLLGLSDRLRELIDSGALTREQAFALLDAGDSEDDNAIAPGASAGSRVS